MRESCLVYCYSGIQSLFEVVLLYTFYTDLEKILCTTNWYTKFFLVYWLITYIIIFSGGIK